jgi:serine/threonine protein kinase
MKVTELGLAPGTVLNGSYEVAGRIASGGIGVVYKAFELETKSPVAIKVLHPEFSADPFFLKLFRREALILRDLRHDALARSYAFAREPELGLHYLAMEYIDGVSLADRLSKGPLPSDVSYELLCRLASGLDAAHQMGIVHRDLSPDNILLPNGEIRKAKIIDFGIARSDGHGTTIVGGNFAGKEQYASPEQIGLFEKRITSRTDIYSLGLVVAHALIGKRIDMGGSHVDLVEKRRKLPDLTEVDEILRPLLEAMLQPNPDDRLKDMQAVLNWSILHSDLPGDPPPSIDLQEMLESSLISALKQAPAPRTGDVAPPEKTERKSDRFKNAIQAIGFQKILSGKWRVIATSFLIVMLFLIFLYFGAVVAYNLFSTRDADLPTDRGAASNVSFDPDSLKGGDLVVSFFATRAGADSVITHQIKPLIDDLTKALVGVRQKNEMYEIVVRGVDGSAIQEICDVIPRGYACNVVEPTKLLQSGSEAFRVEDLVDMSFGPGSITLDGPSTPGHPLVKSGTYIVQVTSQRTAAAVSEAVTGLRKRYPVVLGKVPVIVVPADVEDRGVFYRGRIPAQGRDQAIALCEALKDKGGDCFVRRSP